MANIRIDVNYAIKDGSEIVFRSPVDCSQITGLVVYYLRGDGNTTSKVFALADAHGNNVGDIDHLFAENVVVKVILDVSHGMAFVQNADTNAYIERTFVKTVNGVAPDVNGNVVVSGGSGGEVFVPKAQVTQTANGATITITDQHGTSTATITNGEDGQDGYTPVKGKDYFDGQPGKDGSDGTDGKDGTSVTVKSVSESTADGGSNVVTFSDGKTLTIKNGSKGSSGSKGDTGASGAAGKTAYQYAQDGGYIGTEAEFAEKLANEYNPNPLHGKKVSFLGDSICAGSSDTYVGGYGKIIADRNNMVYENLAKGGATVTAETYSSSTGTAKSWLCRMVDSMSADADYAIVEGGVNDAWQYSDHGNIEIGEISNGYSAVLDDTTYYGAFESMLKKLVTKFKGKKIGYIATPKMMSLYDSNRNAPNFYHIALECCAKWGVPVCDLNTIIPPTEYLRTLGTEYTADGTHPTHEGYLKYYCDPIEAWMKTLTTGGGLLAGTLLTGLDDKYVQKNDISIKQAQLTLKDGSTVLIDVVVASEGTTIKKYTNKVPISTDTDGNIFNGVGYQTGYRLNSSGATKEQSYSAVTGFIPAKANDVIYIAECGWYHESAQNYLCAYKADFSFIGAVTSNVSKYGTQIHSNVALDGERGIVTLADVADIAYIRVSAVNFGDCEVCESLTLGEDMIVTVNEEIT